MCGKKHRCRYTGEGEKEDYGIIYTANYESAFTKLSRSSGGGKKGIDRTDIYWVSLVEDYGTEKFKNINEIVITSCVNGTEESLLEFAKNLYLAKGRALMVNVGKYIKEMPKELIAFCNEVDLPLYAIPWDVLMSDVVKDISHILMYDEVKNISITELMQSILFQTKSMESQIGNCRYTGFRQKPNFAR